MEETRVYVIFKCRSKESRKTAQRQLIISGEKEYLSKWIKISKDYTSYELTYFEDIKVIDNLHFLVAFKKTYNSMFYTIANFLLSDSFLGRFVSDLVVYYNGFKEMTKDSTIECRLEFDPYAVDNYLKIDKTKMVTHRLRYSNDPIEVKICEYIKMPLSLYDICKNQVIKNLHERDDEIEIEPVIYEDLSRDLNSGFEA